MDELEEEMLEEAVLSQCITKDTACEIVSECNCITKMTLACYDELICRIFNAQLVDVVEVVRCKDCEHWIQSFGYDGKEIVIDGRRQGECECLQIPNHIDDYYVVNDDFYCAYGKRRNDETEE